MFIVSSAFNIEIFLKWHITFAFYAEGNYFQWKKNRMNISMELYHLQKLLRMQPTNVNIWNPLPAPYVDSVAFRWFPEIYIFTDHARLF